MLSENEVSGYELLPALAMFCTRGLNSATNRCQLIKKRNMKTTNNFIR